LTKEHGIIAAFLYKYRQDFQEFGIGSFPAKGNLKFSSEQAKTRELEDNYKKQN
jgi:transposase